MSLKSMRFEENDIAVHFATQDTLDAALFSQVIIEIVALLKSDHLFGADAEVRLAEVAMGSLTARLKINLPTALTVGTFALGIPGAVKDIADLLQDPKATAGECAAIMMVDQSVTEIVVQSADARAVVPKDNAAVRSLELRRELEAQGITSEVMDQLDELVNVKMPQALGSAGAPTVQLQDLKKFTRSALVFPEFMHLPEIDRDRASTYRARGVVRKREDGSLVFVDQADHPTPIEKIDADWDVPLDRPVDIWFAPEQNKPLPFRKLTVVQVDIV